MTLADLFFGRVETDEQLARQCERVLNQLIAIHNDKRRPAHVRWAAYETGFLLEGAWRELRGWL